MDNNNHLDLLEDKESISLGSQGGNRSHPTSHDALPKDDQTRVEVNLSPACARLSLPEVARPVLSVPLSNNWSTLSRFQPYTQSFPAFRFDRGELNWDAELLHSGHLFFPNHDKEEGKSVEVRIRCALAAHPGWTQEDVMDFAVAHCLPFRVMAPVSRMSGIVSAESSIPDIDHENPQEVVRRWKAGLADFFKRRHSRALLFLGGIETRLALMVGGLDFVGSAMQGADLTGPRCTEERDGQVFIDDAVTADEVNLLLGCITPAPANRRKVVRSLWPSSAQLKSKFSEHFTGDWNSPCEDLFQAIWREVNGQKPKLRNITQWRTFFKHGGRTNSTSPSLEQSAWREAHEVLIEEVEWHGMRMSDLFPQITVHSAT